MHHINIMLMLYCTSCCNIWMWYFQSSRLKSGCEEIVVQEVVQVPGSNAAERLCASEGIVKRCWEHRHHSSRSFRVSTVAEFVSIYLSLFYVSKRSAISKVPELCW